MENKEVIIALNEVPGSYYAFVVAVLNYIKKKPSRAEAVERFMNEHEDATPSDILRFISDQPDFYEDAAYAEAQVG